MNVEEMIDDLFSLKRQLELWPIIKMKYEAFGFTDDISDKDRIEEYNYVIEQFYKFVFKNEATIRRCGTNLERMLTEVEALAEKASDKGTTRKELVYHSMRDDWIWTAHEYITALMAELEEE